MRRLSLTLLAIAAVLIATTPATAQKRVALIIGNSTYLHAPKLPNTGNDADAVAILFRDLGFDIVQSFANVPASEMRVRSATFPKQHRAPILQ